MTASLYDHALACDIAFSFRDLAREAAGMADLVARESRIPVARVLDIGCGTAPHLPELVRRGWAYTGIDSSPAMLDFARRRAREFGIEAHFLEGDLVRFAVPGPVDFSFVALNSLYIRTLADAESHLASVAAALRPGGLHLLDWCVQNVPLQSGEHRWQVSRDGISVDAAVTWSNVDEPTRLFDETVVFEVDDRGTRKTCGGTVRRRAVYPDEFNALVLESGAFEIAGWWDDWDFSRKVARLGTAAHLQVAIRRIPPGR